MIALAHTAALLLDHKTGTVRPVEYDGELSTLREILGVEFVDAEMLDENTIIFYDETGSFNEYKIGFEIAYQKIKIKIAGSALITGDDCGQNAPIFIRPGDLIIKVVKYD